MRMRMRGRGMYQNWDEDDMDGEDIMYLIIFASIQPNSILKKTNLSIRHAITQSCTVHHTAQQLSPNSSPGTKREGLGPFALAIAMRMSSSSSPSKGSRDRIVRPNML